MLHPPVFFRPLATGFAAVLGLLAAWTLAAEATRPSLGYFPTTAAETKLAAAENGLAATAAWLGLLRGNLWTDYAVTANAGLIEAAMGNAPIRADAHAQDVAETAALSAPSDARSWLLLAANAQAASNSANTTALLKMSYYTSPYSDALFPLRIHVVTRSTSIADDELATFVDYELSVAVGQKPGLKRSIAAAYRAASSGGRRFFDGALAKLDTSFLNELKSARP
jgi:predicted small integral membrane protein